MRDELDELLGIDNEDPIQRLAAALVDSDDRLLRMLVNRRRQLDLTQKQVGERMGVTQPAVNAFERADADPKLSTIRRYALAVHALVSHSVDPGVDARRITSYPRHVTARSDIETGMPGAATSSHFLHAPAKVSAVSTR